jgi:hypothetical protein
MIGTHSEEVQKVIISKKKEILSKLKSLSNIKSGFFSRFNIPKFGGNL